MYDRNAFLALSTGLWIGVTLLAGFWMVGALMVGPVTYLLHTYVVRDRRPQHPTASSSPSRPTRLPMSLSRARYR
jgi:hypothetical protein